jgi:hypothetical protein
LHPPWPLGVLPGGQPPPLACAPGGGPFGGGGGAAAGWKFCCGAGLAATEGGGDGGFGGDGGDTGASLAAGETGDVAFVGAVTGLLDPLGADRDVRLAAGPCVDVFAGLACCFVPGVEVPVPPVPVAPVDEVVVVGVVVSLAAAGCEPDFDVPPEAGDVVEVVDVVAVEGVVVSLAAGLTVPLPFAAAPVAGEPVAFGVTAADGVVVTPLALGSGCWPFIPGNAWPGWLGVVVESSFCWPEAGEPGVPVAAGLCSAAFCATDGGSDGPSAAAPDEPGAAGGVITLLCPAALVTVTLLVTLLMTTVLWTLAKITLLAGGAAT